MYTNWDKHSTECVRRAHGCLCSPCFDKLYKYEMMGMNVVMVMTKSTLLKNPLRYDPLCRMIPRAVIWGGWGGGGWEWGWKYIHVSTYVGRAIVCTEH